MGVEDLLIYFAENLLIFQKVDNPAHEFNKKASKEKFSLHFGKFMIAFMIENVKDKYWLTTATIAALFIILKGFHGMCEDSTTGGSSLF